MLSFQVHNSPPNILNQNDLAFMLQTLSLEFFCYEKKTNPVPEGPAGAWRRSPRRTTPVTTPPPPPPPPDPAARNPLEAEGTPTWGEGGAHTAD